MKNIERVEKIINSIYKKINKCFQKGNYRRTLHLIKTYASIMYSYNQIYADSKVEEILYKTINLIFPKPDLKKSELNEKTVIFYDGFGIDNRGLAQIYLKALCKKYHVIYITAISNKKRLHNIIELLRLSNNDIYYIKGKNINSCINELINVTNKIKPKNMFLYTYPNDIVGISFFELFEDIICRYQINLTDHAFWLGIKAFDYCIEFRDYGASISAEHRNINKEKLFKLPFYPNINYSQEFEGYPFEFDETKNKFIFSGGALYKTIGDGNKYYHMIEKIIIKYPDLFFWYAGSGDNRELRKLMDKYPNRVFYTSERKDLYQVLKRCYFYFSTYPICGGLMFQYAAKANKLPITLTHDNITDEFLLNQDNLNVIFDSEEEMYQEIDKIYNDKKYKEKKEKDISNSVITEEKFEKNLYQLIEIKKSEFDIIYKKIDIDKFRKTYKENINIMNIYQIFFHCNRFNLILQFPYITLYGFVLIIMNEMKKIQRKFLKG